MIATTILASARRTFDARDYRAHTTRMNNFLLYPGDLLIASALPCCSTSPFRSTGTCSIAADQPRLLAHPRPRATASAEPSTSASCRPPMSFLKIRISRPRRRERLDHPHRQLHHVAVCSCPSPGRPRGSPGRAAPPCAAARDRRIRQRQLAHAVRQLAPMPFVPEGRLPAAGAHSGRRAWSA